MPSRDVIFGLVRGYPWHKLHDYSGLLARNTSVRRYAETNDFSGDIVLFHEGNIGRGQQYLLQKAAKMPIRFIDVGSTFALWPEHRWSGESDFPLGYSLMCRFQYHDVWDLLERYDRAVRVDEDVVLKSLGDWDSDVPMRVGAVVDESHERTNSTLPGWLESRGWEGGYSHEFPYTNVYMTRVEFWHRQDVREFLNCIASHPDSVDLRWGDLPVLGVALNLFGGWSPSVGVDPNIRYAHGSHRVDVEEGRVLWG